MTSSPRSRASSTELFSNSTSDESLKEDEHDWDLYLVETNSEAAPACNFRQALNPPTNEFKINDKLESVDPRNQDSWCIGTIIDKDGPRLRIRLDGTDDRNDFWRLVDSADIRVYGTTEKLGQQIVPPLGFQQTSTRWAKYFERHVKGCTFASESCFKTSPPKPEKNLFKRGQKLETVDPRHPHLICPATVESVMSGDHRIVLSLDGWSLSNNFKIDYASRDLFPVGWCQSAGIRIAKLTTNLHSRTSNKISSTKSKKSNGNIRQKRLDNTKDIVSSLVTMDEKNNNLTRKKKSISLINIRKNRKISTDLEDINEDTNQKRSIVTAYLNYDDNSGAFLNPQKFNTFMPTVFGPDECHIVLTSIFDSCIQCAFQQTAFIKRILDIFPTPNNEDKDSYTKIKLEKGTILYIGKLKTQDDFWNVIRLFQNKVLYENDLFISKPVTSANNQNDHSHSNIRHLSPPLDKNESLSLSTSINISKTKRKSTELITSSENKTFLSNEKVRRTNLNEKSVYETNLETSTNQQTLTSIKTDLSTHPERYTPTQVAAVIKDIDPSFENLSARFLQEEIDGKALLLLTTDTLMRHMGLKLGPSLKIFHHIEKLKKR